MARRPRGRLAARARRDRAHRRADAPHVAVVDRRPRDAGHVRPRHLEVHGDGHARSRPRRSRTRSCAASATGSSTAAIASGRGSSRRASTRSGRSCSLAGYGLVVAEPARRGRRAVAAPACSSSRCSLVGMIIAVGPSPYAHPTPLGAIFKAFATSSSAGLALRSTARAVPLVVLALAVLLGLGVNASCRRRCAGAGIRAIGAAVIGVVVLLVVVNLPALFDGTLLRQEPRAARAGARVLDAGDEVPRRAGRRDARARGAGQPTSPRTRGATPSTRSRPG